MIYFANPCAPCVREAMQKGLLGCITTPVQGNRVPTGTLWCADNGCFGSGYPGDEQWLAWLEWRSWQADMGLCLFATVPDVVGNAQATLQRSMPFFQEVRDRGYYAAYVLQDGIEGTYIPWDHFDNAFIGGTTEFKLGRVAADVGREALGRGKLLHMGRVNSRNRLRYAHSIGCQSVDGTYLKFGPECNLPKLTSWLSQLRKDTYGF